MRGGYFATGGYTETGGLGAFLPKLRQDITWERCFPACKKPAPKLGRRYPQPQDMDCGVTGEALIARMISRLQRHYSSPCPFDVIALIDDADCRFASASSPDQEYQRWSEALTAAVLAATAKPDLKFIVLLAFPEVETWLLSDWSEAFGREYREVDHALRRHVDTCLLAPLDRDHVEQFGGRLLHGSCERKLSAELQQAFTGGGRCGCTPPFPPKPQPSVLPSALAYSKSQNGAAMLKRVRPVEIAQHCPRFRAAANELDLVGRIATSAVTEG